MKGSKKGQFFLLAAVIISVIVISLGATTNRVIVSENNFKELDDFSYQVDREIGEVLNYEVYTRIDSTDGGDGEGRVEEFARLIATEMQDKDPNMEFIFIFGNYESMTVANYGEGDIGVTPTMEHDEMKYCKYDVGYWNHDEYTSRTSCGVDDDCYACAEICLMILSMDVCSVFDISYVDGANKDKECMINARPVECSAGEFDEDAGEIVYDEEALSGKEEILIEVEGIEVRIPISNHSQVYVITKKIQDGEVYVNAQ